MKQQVLEAKLLRIEAMAQEALSKPDGARLSALIDILKIAQRS
jgi:hypothetical protein